MPSRARSTANLLSTDGVITGDRIDSDAITSPLIAPSTILTSDLADNAVTIEKASFIDSDALDLPTGATADRPGVLSSGLLRFNSETSEIEIYNGSAWQTANPPIILTANVTGGDSAAAQGDWVDSSPWIATVPLAGILSTDRAEVDLLLDSVSYDSAAVVSTAWATIYRIESLDSSLSLYSTALPTSDFKLSVRIRR